MAEVKQYTFSAGVTAQKREAMKSNAPADQMLYVQYGCAACAPEGWLNFDASLRVRLGIRGGVFPRNVRYGDIVRGLPVKDGTAKAVYASHVLEHLTREDFDTALLNTYRILMDGGTFRLIVPDLEIIAGRYVEKVRSGQTDANDWFMTTICVRNRRTLVGWLEDFIGHGRHEWMWDFPSTRCALERCGFRNIRRCEYGDNPDPMFTLVEEKDRFVWSVSIECQK